MKLDVFEYSNKGGRSYNEDSAGWNFEDGKGVFIVADGLGGHSFGELASQCAVSTIIGGWQGIGDDPKAMITAAVKNANDSILELQKQKNTMMKSTLALLALENGRIAIANSGDSRVYCFHNNELTACTEDHSVAYKKYKAGEITRDMLATDEDQSRLLRSLGGTDRYEPDVKVMPYQYTAGDAFLLCSDGAWEYLRDEEILIDLFKAEDARQWAELLLLRIMGRINGENDNLSLITVRLEA